jgi:hypothetical protein
MADIDNTEQCIKELVKTIGTVFYVVNQLDELQPEHYPLWVAVHRAMDVIEDLKRNLGLEVDDLNLH